MAEERPVKLTSPRVWRTYVGGSRIDAIHGIGDSPDGQFPEEWIMSTVNARNVGREHITDEACATFPAQSSPSGIISRRILPGFWDGSMWKLWGKPPAFW